MSFLFQSQKAQRARAETEAEKAKQVSAFLRDMLSSVESKGESVTVREVLDFAARDLEGKFREQPEVEAALHSTIGSAYAALREFDEASRHLQRSLEMRQRLFGDRHPEVAESLIELATFERRKSWDKTSLIRADSLAHLSLEMRRELLGENHADVAASLDVLAELRSMQGQYAAADSLYQTALAQTTQRLGNGHPDVARLLQGRAHPLYFQGKKAEAEAVMREALTILRAAYPGDHFDKADCIHDLAFVLGQTAEADTLLVEQLAMNRRLWGEGHPKLTRPLTTLGVNWMRQHRLDEAEPLLREALEIAESHSGLDHIEVAAACNNLAALLHGKKEYAEEAKLYRRALAIWDGKLRADDRSFLICKTNLAGALDNLGRDDEAWALLLDSVELGKNHVGGSALHLRVMAEFLNRRGRWAEAEACGREALEICREVGDQGHRVSCVLVVATALRGQGRAAEAEPLYAEADSLYQQSGKKIGSGLENLIQWGTCLRDLRRLEEAEQRLLEAQEFCIQEHGEDYPQRSEIELALEQTRASRRSRPSAESDATENIVTPAKAAK